MYERQQGGRTPLPVVSAYRGIGPNCRGQRVDLGARADLRFGGRQPFAGLHAAGGEYPLVGRCAVERRRLLAGANPARQLLLQPVAIGAGYGGNDMA